MLEVRNDPDRRILDEGAAARGPRRTAAIHHLPDAMAAAGFDPKADIAPDC
jgi:hypothetical protein